MRRMAVGLVVLVVVALAAMAFAPALTASRTTAPAGRTPAAEVARPASGTAAARPDLTWGITNLTTFTPIAVLAADPVHGTILSVTRATPGLGFSNDTVKVISDTNYSVLAKLNVSVNTAPRLAVDTANGDVFLTNISGSLLRLSGTTLGVLSSVGLLPRVTGVLYDPANGDVYVAEGCNPSLGVYGGNLSVVNGSTLSVITTIPLPCSPTAMVADGHSGNVFVLSGDPGNLTVISGANQTVLTTLPNVTAGPSSEGALTADPFNGLVYVKCSVLGSPGCLVTVNGTTGAAGTPVTLGTAVQGAFVVDGDRHVDFLGWSNSSTNQSEDLYSVPSAGGSFQKVASAPCAEDALAWNPVNRELVAAGHCGENGHDAVLSFYALGPYRLDTTVTLSNLSFVLSTASEDLTVVDPVTGITAASFLLRGLGSNLELVGPFPFTVRAALWVPGVNWTVTVTHPSGFVESLSTSDPSLTLYLANGSYTFALSVPFGYSASSSSGSFTMTGVPVDRSTTISWSAWFWAVLLAGLGVVVYGGIKGRRLRREFHDRRAGASARLRYDLEHPLTAPGENETGRYPPP